MISLFITIGVVFMEDNEPGSMIFVWWTFFRLDCNETVWI